LPSLPLLFSRRDEHTCREAISRRAPSSIAVAKEREKERRRIAFTCGRHDAGPQGNRKSTDLINSPPPPPPLAAISLSRNPASAYSFRFMAQKCAGGPAAVIVHSQWRSGEAATSGSFRGRMWVFRRWCPPPQRAMCSLVADVELPPLAAALSSGNTEYDTGSAGRRPNSP